MTRRNSSETREGTGASLRAAKGKSESGKSGYRGENMGEYRDDLSGKRQNVTDIFSNGTGEDTAGAEFKGNCQSPSMERNETQNFGDVEGTLHAELGAGLDNFVDQLKTAHRDKREKIKSPSSYLGPLFSEVKRTVKESCMGSSLKGPVIICRYGRKEEEVILRIAGTIALWWRRAKGKKRAVIGGNHSSGLDNKGKKQNSYENRRLDRDWRRLLCSPADRNEDYKLELPGA
jgi:hypothetical protein